MSDSAPLSLTEASRKLESECETLEEELCMALRKEELLKYQVVQQHAALETLQKTLKQGQHYLIEQLERQHGVSSLNFERQKVVLIDQSCSLLDKALVSEVGAVPHRFPELSNSGACGVSVSSVGEVATYLPSMVESSLAKVGAYEEYLEQKRRNLNEMMALNAELSAHLASLETLNGHRDF